MLRFFCLILPLFVSVRAVKAQSPWAYIITLAGNGNPGNQNDPCTNQTSQVNNPFGIALSANGSRLYFADQGNHQIRFMDNPWSGSCQLGWLAGDSVPGFLDTIATHARFNGPTNVCVDTLGNVYVSDFNNHRIRKISVGGWVTTLAGSGIAGYQDGSGDSARFCFPRGLAVDDSGNVYVSDSWNHRIRKISPSGMVTTLAGGGSITGVGSSGTWRDGPDTTARFYTPAGLFYLRTSSCLLVADAYNHRIRRIELNGRVTTLMGSGASGPSGGGYSDGPDTLARLNTPTELTAAWLSEFSDTIVFVSDSYNHGIRGMGMTQKMVFTEAGVAGAGFAEGNRPGQFNFPRGIVILPEGSASYSIVIADFANHRIRGIQDIWLDTEPLHNLQSGFIFPNPNSGVLYFRELMQSITLMDATGRISVQMTEEAGIEQLNISTLPKGLYLIQGMTTFGAQLYARLLLQTDTQ